MNAFVEWISNNGADSGAIAGPAVYPGDYIESYVDWEAGAPGANGLFTYSTYDATYNESYTSNVYLPETNYDPYNGPSGATAEAVDERPAWNSNGTVQYEALKPWGQNTINWSEIEDGYNYNNWEPFSDRWYDNWYMTSVSDTSQILAQPISYGGPSGTLTDQWVQCGHWEKVPGT
ncbi:MAG: hypothetical protein ACYC1D_07390 [Acidimicrobiales bacterium]